MFYEFEDVRLVVLRKGVITWRCGTIKLIAARFGPAVILQ